VAANSPTTVVVGVTNGLFTLPLDFGAAAFAAGAGRWLKREVRTSLGPFTALSPRQALTPAPYALAAGNLTGTVPNSGLSGTYNGAVTFNNAANSFTGSGAGLASLNASQLTSGTVPDARLGANVARLNTDATFSGRVEALGELQGHRLDVGTNHWLTGNLATIAGGRYNTNRTGYATIGGGFYNPIQTGAEKATIGGGHQNTIQTNAGRIFILPAPQPAQNRFYRLQKS